MELDIIFLLKIEFQLKEEYFKNNFIIKDINLVKIHLYLRLTYNEFYFL